MGLELGIEFQVVDGAEWILGGADLQRANLDVFLAGDAAGWRGSCVLDAEGWAYALRRDGLRAESGVILSTPCGDRERLYYLDCVLDGLGRLRVLPQGGWRDFIRHGKRVLFLI